MASTSFLARFSSAAFGELETLLSPRVLAEYAAALPPQSFSRMRTAMLRAAGVKIGTQSLIQGAVRITGDANPCSLVSIGDYTIISGPLHIDAGAPVRIGSGVRIGHDVTLLTINHEIGAENLRSGTRTFEPIAIGDGCWLASRTTILPGVSIGNGSVVAAGAVVTRDVPANSLVAGVPARVIRQLETA